MNEYLKNNYALFNKEVKANRGLIDGVKKVTKNPTSQYLFFGVIVCLFGLLVCTIFTRDVKALIPKEIFEIIKMITGPGDLTDFATTFIFGIAAIGFCLLMGYSGLASLGIGGCIGIGTYSVRFIMVESNMPFVLALVAAVGVAILVGLVVGFISLRIEGIYLVILTLALSEILRTVYSAVPEYATVTYYADFSSVLGLEYENAVRLAFITIFLVVIMIITTNLIKSPTGRAMLAMKNSTAAAQAMGISLIKYRLMAFVICTAYAALAGVLYMTVIPSVTATDPTGPYALITSLNILAAVIIGGYKSIWGALFGTFIMWGLEKVVFLKLLKIFFKVFFDGNPTAEVQNTVNVMITVFSGILVIIIAMYFPGGLAQLLAELKLKISKLFKKMKEAKYGKDLG